MFKGIACALSACLIWGLVFIIPQFMGSFSSIEVALGRFLVYGIVSSLIFCKSRLFGACRYPRTVWIKSIYFSLMCTFVCYTCLVLALRHATPAISALILGISPITIAFYGNWKQKEISFKRLVVPSLLILLGLILINIPHFRNNASPSSYILGLGCCFLSLIAWSWYVVTNARFLKQNPELRPVDWSTLIGVATFFWAILFAGIIVIFFENHLPWAKYGTWTPEMGRFVIGSAILGLLCSWVSAFLWNRASFYLPVSLAGQLMIFETIFGVIFVYLLEGRIPPLLESIGILILLSAIIYGIRQFASKEVYQ